MKVMLHIERLVLDEAVLGSEPARDVGASIERELARRFAEPGAAERLARIGAVDRLPAPASGTRGALGTRVASAVGETLAGPPTRGTSERRS
jgi:hypothetical protein